jgi:polysaccharide biosynthesis/export protein
MRASIPAFSLVAIACLLSGCESGPGISTDPSRAVVSTTNLPEPDPTASSTSLERDYHVGPLDQLDITVFQVDDLTRTVEVDAVGRISLPLIGEIDAAGKTPMQLQTEIADKLGKYVRSPQVNVYVKQAQSQKITIEGAVVQPGVYPVAGRTTLVQALAMAHGVDRFAKLKQIVVFRTIKGQRMAAMFDLDGIRSGKYPDPEVFGDDLIEVDQNSAKRTLFDIVEAAPLLDVFRVFP